MFKKLSKHLNRRQSGNLFTLLGFITVFSAPLAGILLLVIAALLPSSWAALIPTKLRAALNTKTRNIIIVFCLIALGTSVDSKTLPAQDKVQDTFPLREETSIVTPADPETPTAIMPALSSSTLEKSLVAAESILDERTIPESIPQSTPKEYYTVTKVVDGDTIDIEQDGVAVRLRLIGIDTPETVDPRRPVECFGLEASTMASTTLLHKKVRLEADPNQADRDKYGRLLRYIYREDGLFFNLWMIENGYAREYTFQIPYRYQTEFQLAEAYARANKRGLWQDSICGADLSVEIELSELIPN